MSTMRDEKAHSINGVAGRMFAATVGGTNYRDGTFTSQTWSASREYKEGRDTFRMRVKIRFDDNCRNGHNTFAITCDIDLKRAGGYSEWGGGAAHEEIARVFPELSHLIKWHLVSTDAPMHYIANTVYHASDCDYRGKRAGEPYAWDDAVSFGANPIKHNLKGGFATFLKEAQKTGINGEAFDFQIIDISEQKTGSTGKIEYYRGFTFGGYGSKWYDCPFKTEEQAADFLFALKHCEPSFHRVPTLFSEGKQRDFAAARASAAWPEATDEQLSLPKEELTKLLQERLPPMQTAFRADIEAIGMMWAPEAETKG